MADTARQGRDNEHQAAADLGAARVSGSEYMSAWEFSRLGIDAQIAVWEAVERRRVAWVTYGSVRCYHREQVRALLEQEAKASR